VDAVKSFPECIQPPIGKNILHRINGFDAHLCACTGSAYAERKLFKQLIVISFFQNFSEITQAFADCRLFFDIGLL
jgi:hypothetical protein